MRNAVLALSLMCLTPVLGTALRAQVLEVRPATPPAATASVDDLRNAQEGFETFRRRRAPVMSVRSGPDRCDERVGRFCYWYDEESPEPPDEGDQIREARARLLAKIDSTGREFPNDRWVSGQRVRYLTEAGRYDEAVRAAQACTAREWWCYALRGFAYHVAGRFEEADSSYEGALRLMTQAERCAWRDMKLLLDDERLRWYREQNCVGRVPVEERVWWLARPMLSSKGNDARTEYYSRLMMGRFIEDAPSAYAMGFDFDERELTLRYGWAIAWTRQPGGSVTSAGMEPGLVGHERTPAHPFLPVRGTLENPASSDSAGWRSKGIPPVQARYSPVYARRLLPLEHQSALFRRGDSALVIASWSVAKDTALSAAVDARELTAAMVLTRSEEKDAVVVRSESPQRTGTLMARSAWGSTLMSIEVAAVKRRTLARARYGVRRTDEPQSRIQVSDIVLYEPYDSTPTSAEDVLSHMRTSERVPVGSRVGIFWEAYNTDPTGEGIEVNITVAPENKAGGGGWLSRGLRALRRVKEAQPVSVGLRDVSARGSPVTARAVEVDLSTLTPGRYLLQLELNAGPNVVRVERAISIVSP